MKRILIIMLFGFSLALVGCESRFSIRKIGQLEPTKIWFTGEDFRIIDGEKRWRACKKIGLTKIKAIILEIEI
jgi:ParB-like chromosome segregation protein Spo0J